MKEKEFVPYKESLELKELGFNESCLGFYDDKNISHSLYLNDTFNSHDRFVYLKAPLYQQVFRWFRDTHKIDIEFKKCDEGYTFHIFRTHEELVKSITKLFSEERENI